MPAKSLYRLATEVCVASIRRIDDVGDTPYHVVRPVLLKIENPQQLKDIEQNCPHIAELSAELWRAFIKRDVRSSKNQNIEPKNPRNWSRLYTKLVKESEAEAREKEEALRAVLSQKTAEKQNNQIQYIDKVITPVPKKIRPQATTFARTGNPALMTFASGSRTKTTTGRGMLEKARREAKERSLFSAQRSVLSTPTHKLGEKASHGRVVGSGSAAGAEGPSSDGALLTSEVPAQPPVKDRGTMTFQTQSSSSAQTERRAPPMKRPAANVFMPKKRQRI